MSDESSVTVAGKKLDPVRGGLLFAVLGLAIVGYGAYDYTQQSAAVEEAVAVDAAVVETGVEPVSTGSTGADYRPTVTFEYSYQGSSYRSDRVYPSALDPNFDTRSAAADVLDGYAENESVTAYVDPDEPGEAFLLNERSNTPLVALAIGAVFVLVGAANVRKGL